jgi:hypothetical protein
LITVPRRPMVDLTAVKAESKVDVHGGYDISDCSREHGPVLQAFKDALCESCISIELKLLRGDAIEAAIRPEGRFHFL